ncbi:MAG: FtsX-like permease family protein, partial [Gemmatimonadetes bacterium]|nr:FtsX-like permease family protein [Gemmatimonadota bacterium]
APVLHGRALGEDDDVAGAGAPVAVLSYALWQEHFLGDPGVLGTDVRLNGTPFTVVGIARDDFRGLELSFQPDAWVTMQAAARLGQGSIARPDIWDDRGGRWMGMLVGRRADGATTEAVRDQFARISQDMQAEYGDLRGPRNTTVDPLDSYALPNGSEENVSRLVWLLLGVVGFTLLLACANLANLLLARGSIRAKDLSVRAALGARRRDLIRQLLVENVLVAAMGGVLGMAVALAILRASGPLSLPGGLTIAELNPQLDASVLGFTALATVATALLFGLLPALHATRTDLHSVLRDGGRGASGRGHRMRKGLVAVQVALCLLLLIGSGLFIATIRNGMAHDPGFRTGGLALARFNLGLLNYEPQEAQTLLNTLTARVAARPGVSAASYATRVPLLPGGASGFFFEVPGYQPRQDEELRVDLVGVGPDYFETLSVPVLAGATPGPAGGPEDPPQVAISRTMAETYWDGASPLGRTVVVGGEEVTVIGVVGDVSWQGLDDEPTNFLYVPLSSMQDRAAGFVTLTVRTTGDPSEALGVLRAELVSLEPDAPITVLSTMEGQVGQVLSAQQTGAAFLTGFGALALLLSALGIGGVVAYVVQQRRRDIGIRMALGADSRSVLAQSTLDMAVPILGGTVVGIGASLLLTRTIEGFLFGVTANDGVTYVSITLVFLAVAACAAALPARRATRVNPVEVLTGD